MSTKSMFYRILLSELIFFLACIFIFVLHLAFWLHERGIAERVFHIHLTPSPIPLYILGIIYLLAVTLFIVLLHKQVKRFKESNYKNSKRAFLLSLGMYVLAFGIASPLLVANDPNQMATVIPGLFSLYFAIAFILHSILFFIFFNGSVKVDCRDF